MSRKRSSTHLNHRHYAEAEHQICHVGIDYITAVALDPESRRALETLAEVAIEDQLQVGNEKKLWTWRGYRGDICGDVAWGHREDSLLMRASGHAGDMWARQAVQCGARPSRLDLAVTIQLDRDLPDLARDTYERAMEYQKNGGRRRSLTLIRSGEEGDTIYIGKRTSPVFLRVYDKWRQSGLTWPAYTWRYEAELKGGAAGDAVKQLSGRKWSPEAVRSITWHVFARSGAQPGWDPGERIHWKGAPRPVSDAERTLGWLHTTVAPAVDHLQQYYSLERILVALGLAVGDPEDYDIESPT